MKLLVAVLLKVKESVDRHETAMERDRNAIKDNEDLVIIVCLYYLHNFAYFNQRQFCYPSNIVLSISYIVCALNDFIL